jgi:hypothetical protein
MVNIPQQAQNTTPTGEVAGIQSTKPEIQTKDLAAIETVEPEAIIQDPALDLQSVDSGLGEEENITISNPEGYNVELASSELEEYNESFTTHFEGTDEENIEDELASLLEEDIQEEPVEVQREAQIKQQEEDDKNLIERIGIITKDVVKGVVAEGPRAALKGGRDALQEVLESIDDLSDFLNKNVIDLSRFETEKKFNLPDITFAKGAKEPTTTTAKGIKSISQFIGGFFGGGKALKAANILQKGTKGTKLTKAVAQGALGDIIAFDEQEKRLSNVIQEVPALRNPLTEFLEADPDDSVALAKLKQGIEGAGLGVLGEGIFIGARTLAKTRALKRQNRQRILDNMTPVQREELGIQGREFSTIGDIEQDKFILKKTEKAIKETEGITPEKAKEIAARKPQNADEIEINFARINGADDVKQAMQAFANEQQLLPSVKDARRGVQTNKATLKLSEDIDGFNSLMSRRRGEAFNAEQVTAARNFYYKTTDKLMEVAAKAAAPQASAIDQYNFRKMVAVHHATQKELLGARAEAGRALQAWSIDIGENTTQNLRAVENLLAEFGGEETSKQLAKKLAQAGTNLTTDQINKVTQKGAGVRSLAAVNELWTLGLLTNPTTHVVNLTSNALTLLWQGGERAVQSIATDSPVTMREAGEFMISMLESQKAAFSNAAKAFKTGQGGFGVNKIELPRIRATSMEELDAKGIFAPIGYAMDAYGKVLNNAGKSLLAGDEYFKTLGFNAQVRALATRDGITKGLKGKDLNEHIAKLVNSPTKDMENAAIDFANYTTYTRELGQTGQSIQRVVSQNPALKFLVPFFKTPTNIFKFTFERTPFALAHPQILSDISEGGMKRAAALSKIGMGSTVMTYVTDQTLNGNITGTGPAEGSARTALRRRGWQPYSIRVGDKYYSYARFEPFATVMGMAADMTEILTNYESYDVAAQDEVDELVVASVMAVSNIVIGKTFLSGLSDTAELFADPKRNGARFVQRYAGSLVPTGIAAIERAVNPEAEFVFNNIDAIRARTLSKDVPKRRNVYGEVIKYRNPGETVLQKTTSGVMSLFNPIYTSEKKDSPIDDFLLRSGLQISMPGKIQDFDGVKINLREFPEIYSRFLELRGQEVRLPGKLSNTMKQFLDKLVQNKLPHSLSLLQFARDKEDQQLILSRHVADYTKAAKKRLIEEFPILRQKILEGEIEAEENRREFLRNQEENDSIKQFP